MPIFSRLGALRSRAYWNKLPGSTVRVAAAAGRILGARGRAGGRRRLAAVPMADGRLPGTAVGAKRWATGGNHGDARCHPRDACRGRAQSTRGRDRGPPRARARRVEKGTWWDRSEVKYLCEVMLAAGVLSVGDPAQRIHPLLRPHRERRARVARTVEIERRRRDPRAGPRLGGRRWVSDTEADSVTTTGSNPCPGPRAALAELSRRGRF